MFSELVIARVLTYKIASIRECDVEVNGNGRTPHVKVIFIELPNEASKVRMFEHVRQYGFRELVHILAHP